MKRKLLIVEDRDDFIEYLSENLKKEYSLNFAKSLEIAKMAMDLRDYDAILTDVHLTDANPLGGIEIISLAKSRGIPCLVMSKENHEKEAMDSGACGFLFKKELISMLKEGKKLSCLSVAKYE
jgi:DNA-binding NtrC family response regulator